MTIPTHKESPTTAQLWHEMEETLDRYLLEAIKQAPNHPPKPPYKPKIESPPLAP